MKTQLLEARIEGRKQGLKEGREEERMDNARKMKELGFTIDVISQVTGLTAEQIEQL